MEVCYAPLERIKNCPNITLRAMAEILGMGQRNYQKYETGEIDPPLSKAIVLADFFNVSLDYLVGRSDDPARH